MDISKILILDDEKELLENLAYDLRDYDVYPTTRTKEALSLNRKNNFDCIITDLKIPKQDGFAFIREVQKKSPNIPIIMITAHGDQFIYKKAQELGVTDFINKPYNKEDLLYLLENITADEKKEAI